MPPEPKVTPDEIVHAALAQIAAGGVRSLSMRGLAKQLGLGTMTLYHHFPDKEALIGRAVDLAVGPLAELAQRQDLEGRPRVLRMALGLYDVLTTYPGIHELRTGGLIGRATTMWVGESILVGLLQAGVPPERAAAGNLLLLDYVSGAAAFPTMVEDVEGMRTLGRALPDGMFEAVATTTSAAVEHFGSPFTRRDMVEYNLAVILDGLGAAQTGDAVTNAE